MINFECDYCIGAHENILRRMEETNRRQMLTYGGDEICESARAKIREACQAPDAQVHFLVGGTQTNTTVIASVLRPHQGVVCAQSGHINVHESGAIESTGHKVISLPAVDGKLTAEALENAVKGHFGDATHEHMVQPGMVYISHPTEIGTLYTLKELESLSAICRKYHLPLYVDGARLGYALACGDVQLPDLARLADIFYIGGTKCGALMGEAVVFANTALASDFRYLIKQRGGMMAKGWLLGIQFDELFTDDLYRKINTHAVEQALLLAEAFKKKGIQMLCDSPTNQQFPILTHAQQEALKPDFYYSYIQKVDDDRDAVRFCTSWATEDRDIVKLLNAISDL